MLDCKLAVWKWEKVRFTHCYWISYWLTAEGWRCSSDQPGFLEGRRPQWLQTTCLHALSFRFPLLLPILFCLLSPSISTMHPCIPPFIPYALFLPLQSYFSPLFPRTGPPSATPPPQMHPLLGSFPPSISGGGGPAPSAGGSPHTSVMGSLLPGLALAHSHTWLWSKLAAGSASEEKLPSPKLWQWCPNWNNSFAMWAKGTVNGEVSPLPKGRKERL